MAIAFSEEFATPFFLLALTPYESDDQRPFPSGNYAFKRVSGGRFKLALAYEGVYPKPFLVEGPKSLTILIGHPIVNGKIARDAASLKAFPLEEPDAEFIRSLNGEFAFFHFNKTNGVLTVVNDRFTAYPIYYYRDRASGAFYATPYFSVLWDALKKTDALKPRQDAFHEFLRFQRLLGTKTFAEEARYLPDASIMTVDGAAVAIHRYWQRNYIKNERSLEENADRMAEGVIASIARKTSDGLRYGHFLSGGMDSRSVLAAFRGVPPICFTATISENRECLTARAIARAKGAEHVHLVLDPAHYGRILRPSVRVNGGMYNYDHGLFYGFNRTVTNLVDAVFHGHGFDYMFQGMYIPRKIYRFAGHNLSLKKRVPLPTDIVGYFIREVSYRTKNADIPGLTLPAKRAELEEALRASVEEILRQAKVLSDNPYDHWEHLTFHHISRHYSYPNHASLATFVEQRTISFDNDLFDLYLSLPVEQRFDARIERRCLKKLSPALAAIPSANTSYPVTASSFVQTLYQLRDAAFRRVKGEPDYAAWMERTWPDRTVALRTQARLREAVIDALAGDALEQIGFLDATRLRADIPRWLDGADVSGISGDFVQTLLTLCVFLKQ